MSKRSRINAMTRNLTVGATSLLLVGSAVGYVVSPVSQSLAASYQNLSVKTGHESIEGRVSGASAGLTVTVEKTVPAKTVTTGCHKVHKNGKTVITGCRTVHTPAKTVVVGHRGVGASGRFSIPVTPGDYQVVFKDGTAKVTEKVTVQQQHAEYFVVKVTKKNHSFGIAPVVFNY